MSQQYPGGFITKSPPTLDPALGNAAPGVWTMDQVTQAIKNGTWPSYDPNFENVTLLLHGNGTNGAQNNTFLDSSTNNFTITRNGGSPGMTQGTFSPYGSNWSNYFDGNADGFYVTGMSSSVSDFCLETWIYSGTSLASGTRVVCGEWGGVPGNLSLIRFSSGSLQINLANSTPLSVAYATHGFVADTWQHMAITRSGSTLRLFRNGTEVGSATFSTAVDFSKINVAAERNGAYNTECWLGYLSNFRVVTGSAVYTSNFTPPTAPLTAITNTGLLTCQSNSFVDNSASPKTITIGGTPSVQRFSPFSPSAAYSASTIGGSGYFDGTADYLSVSGMSSSITGDITLEAYCYLTVAYPTVASETIFGPWQTGTTLILLRIDGSTLEFYLNGSSVFSVNVSSYFKAASWNHIAVSRGSGTLRAFVNGTQVFSGANSSTIDLSSLRIGSAALTGSDIWDGYFSSLRISSSARYTSGFTPSSSPFTSDANTLLLLNFTNAGIIDNAMMNVIETRGNAQISTTQSKFGGASISLPSGVTNLTIPFNQNLAFDSGDFTIEGWVYPNAVSTGTIQSIYASPVNAAQYSAVIFEISAGNSFQVSFSTGASWNVLRAACGTAVATTWQHFAIVRTGTTFYVFINGTQTYTTTISGALTPGVNPAVIGSGRFAVDSLYFQGFIDDFRITKGVARYTANFTPQTSQWQDQ